MTETTKKERLFGIDYVKGCLIILVFVGHIIPGDISEVFPRYAIYSFHMPLFIGISGFLLNIERLDISFSTLVPKYWKRLILPWIIAVLLFFFETNLYKGNAIDVKNFIAAFTFPWYHLWYILGFISYLIISCILWICLKKMRYRWILIFGIAFCISTISKWNILGSVFIEGYSKMIYDTIQYDFRLYNYVFFVVGLFLRYCYEHSNTLSIKHIEILRCILVIAMIMMMVTFFNRNINLSNILFYIMCIIFLIIILYDCINKYIPRSNILEFLGKYSLPIYLYHILCIQIAHLKYEQGSNEYYVICIITFIILCTTIYYFRKNKLFGKIFFGITHT